MMIGFFLPVLSIAALMAHSQPLPQIQPTELVPSVTLANFGEPSFPRQTHDQLAEE